MIKHSSCAWLLLVAIGCGRTIDDATNQPPVAAAGVDFTAEVGVQVALDGTGSMDADGEIVIARWTFGDGAEADGLVATHVYQLAGSYVATLTLTDDDRAVSTDEVIVQVGVPGLTARAVVTPDS